MGGVNSRMCHVSKSNHTGFNFSLEPLSPCSTLQNVPGMEVRPEDHTRTHFKGSIFEKEDPFKMFPVSCSV